MTALVRAGGATLPVSEVFGPTLQGEGPHAGRLATFIRLGGCDLSCAWCDTAYTWDGSRYDLRVELTPTSPEALAAQAGTPIVVITGGEPLLHQDSPAWARLLDLLRDRGHTIHVETNGTRGPNEVSLASVTAWVVSPKLPSAGPHRGHQDPALHPDWPALAWEGTGVHLKVVCADEAEVAQAAALASRTRWPGVRVWVMPRGTTRAELDATWPVVAQAATEHGLNATHRLHVLAWGDERGR
ncbi:radical SAM protein [Frankia sp. R43]|uniref:7-carboxy-7-deazaguanine synthase QueE n=1 Tax=Frankia sp. R43 TaxID=269536 RepID=UPI000ACF7885|nr:radical SAM protein [Frankia sp. R43]